MQSKGVALLLWSVAFHLSLRLACHLAWQQTRTPGPGTLVQCFNLFKSSHMIHCDLACVLTALCRWGGEGCVPALSTWGGWTSCHVTWGLQSCWSEETRKTCSLSTASEMSPCDQCWPVHTELELRIKSWVIFYFHALMIADDTLIL